MKTLLLSLLGLVSVLLCVNGEEPSAVENIVEYGADQSNLEYPCEGSTDFKQCVRLFLRDNSNCAIVNAWNDAPVAFASDLKVHTPNGNITLILKKEDSTMSNLNGDIQTFYVNRNTGNLVMSVEYKNLFVKADNIRFTLHQRGEEPIVITEYGNGTYNIITTLVAPLPLTPVGLQNSISTYIPSYDPSKLFFGPKFIENPDPRVQGVIGALFSDVPTVYKEFFLDGGTRALILTIQKFLCDFGISA